MRLETTLSFIYGSKHEAEAIVKAVTPDNLRVPRGLKVETTRNGNCLSALVICEKSLETFIATMDDLLACISVAEKTLETVKPIVEK
jgi:2-keto-4-pentenoate hydratase/2-oxohepta-3-ene-1,7-dioic acid hydratase in catechol pathway